MSLNPGTEIEQWLIEGSLEVSPEYAADEWYADFDAERQVVVSRIGSFNKLFLRPKKYVKRFYHTVYPILIENWQMTDQVQLFDDFCRIDVQLDIRFQASFAYVQSQQEILSELNDYIKRTYQSGIMDIVHIHLADLQDDSWVKEGLGRIEKAIALAVCEKLVVENIQSQAMCKLKATFAEFPQVQLGKEAIYLSVLKKNYEVTEQNREELFRQQQLEQQQQLAHQQHQLEHYEKIAEITRKRQAQDTEQQKQLLLDQQRQQQEKLELEALLHNDKVKHDCRLKEIALQAELEQKKRRAEQERIAEQQLQIEALAHKARLKDQEVQAEIERYTSKQTQWLAAKAKRQEEKLHYEFRQEQIKFDMQAENKRRQEEERMKLQQQNYENTRNSDIYLRREIELLELDQKRLALQLEIQETKKRDNVE